MAVLSEESDEQNDHKSVWQFLIVNLVSIAQKDNQKNDHDSVRRFPKEKEIDPAHQHVTGSFLELVISFFLEIAGYLLELVFGLLLDSLEKGVDVFVEKGVIPALSRIRERLRKRQ